MDVPVFLTAYDPSDLPGTSVDPLGFERGYLFLADKILPGLTNVANRPRYFSALCAGTYLSDRARETAQADAPRKRYERRLETVQRLERFWALACTLASLSKPADLSEDGIRGIRYVKTAIRKLEERDDTTTSADFRLLSRQLTYGMVGIYGTVADTLRFIDRRTLTLGPELGRRVALAFVQQTEMPTGVQTAVMDGGAISITALTKWGIRAHVNAKRGPEEWSVLREALRADPVRERMADILGQYPVGVDETELGRLQRIWVALQSTGDHPDLCEAILTILAYEKCFRPVTLVLFRLLWFCQSGAPFCYELSQASEDPVLVAALGQLRAARDELGAALEESKSPLFQAKLERLRDARQFVDRAAASKTGTELVEAVLLRHRDVQRAKLDGGRPKMPWLEVTKGKVVPTLSVALRMRGEPTSIENVLFHSYRTTAADRFLQAGGL